MKIKPMDKCDKGFSAIELLITLFIAVVFLITGYQLYASITKDSGITRIQASANNTATDYLQRYKTYTTSPCTKQTPLTDSPISIAGMVNVTVSVTIECPTGSGSDSVSKINATIKYGNPQRTITNSTYSSSGQSVTKDQLLSFDAANIYSYPRSGAVWNDLSPNNNDGGFSNMSYSTSSGGSLSFNGTNGSVIVTSTQDLNFSTDGSFSIEAWIKPDTVTSAWIRGLIVQENYLNSGYRLGIVNGGAPRFWTTQSGGTLLVTSSQALSPNQWAQVAVTYDNQQAVIYVNGQQTGTGSGTYIAGSNSVRIGHTVQEYYSGLMGEVSYYSRALTADEVLQKFNTLRTRYDL